MLIAISGAQGSGKTTLIEELKKELGYSSVERKTSRSILEEWNVDLSEVYDDMELFTKFQDEILLRKKRDELKSINRTIINAQGSIEENVILTERTFMDLAAYACAIIGNKNKYSDWLTRYITSCIEAQGMYEMVFYLKSGIFPVVCDGIRPSNIFYSQMIDMVMYDLTKKYTLSDALTTIDVGDMKLRTIIVKSAIMRSWQRLMRQN